MMLRDRRLSGWLRAAAAALLAGCSANAPEGSEEKAQAPAPTSVERRREIIENARPEVSPRRPVPPQRSSATGEVPQALLELFREDLSRRALVKPETIAIVSATEEQWPDGSLGCGRPGEVYTQMIVPGYRVVLSAAGRQYAYHSDRRGRFVVCTTQGPAAPVSYQTQGRPPVQ